MLRKTATLLSLLMLTTTSVAAAESEERSIRAGFTIAAERCASCHVASPHQTLTPIAPDAPKFVDIANQHATSQESLIKFLGSAHGFGASSEPRPTLALNVLTDQEKSDLAFYVLSLRNEH